MMGIPGPGEPIKMVSEQSKSGSFRQTHNKSKQTPKLLGRVSMVARQNYYSLHTERTYIEWIRRFILFHGKRHPEEMGAEEISAFLSHLAVERRVSAATQNVALNAINFLYTRVLKREMPELVDVARAKRSRRVPVVLSRAEVRTMLDHLEGRSWLMAVLLYGAGLRLSECIRLRVKDVDFSYRQVIVRDGKGKKDRVTMLPESLLAPLAAHSEQVKAIKGAVRSPADRV